jgi:hypothetical protein
MLTLSHTAKLAARAPPRRLTGRSAHGRFDRRQAACAFCERPGSTPNFSTMKRRQNGLVDRTFDPVGSPCRQVLDEKETLRRLCERPRRTKQQGRRRIQFSTGSHARLAA